MLSLRGSRPIIYGALWPTIGYIPVNRRLWFSFFFWFFLFFSPMKLVFKIPREYIMHSRLTEFLLRLKCWEEILLLRLVWLFLEVLERSNNGEGKIYASCGEEMVNVHAGLDYAIHAHCGASHASSSRYFFSSDCLRRFFA